MTAESTTSSQTPHTNSNKRKANELSAGAAAAENKNNRPSLKKNAYRSNGTNGNNTSKHNNKNNKPLRFPQQLSSSSSQQQQQLPQRPKNAYDDMKWIVVRNDGKPESMIKLVGLKSLFSKQLPKMPKAYIARLVFDRRHTSLAILHDNPAVKESDEEIIGGICYRAFEDMRFAEIAFCAVNANHQVKGYGTKLMNLLKKIGAATGIEYFITYADNYAIGYFKKQGFTKNISMPKGRYTGLIKEYDGGTPMECYVHPSIDFTRIPEMLDAQREYILAHVRKVAHSHLVYPPLPKNFTPKVDDANHHHHKAMMMQHHLGGVSMHGIIASSVVVSASMSRANQTAARALAIPGIAEAGWTLPDLLVATGAGKESDRQRSALKNEMLQLLRKVQDQHFAWPFREPVDTSVVPDYLDVIKEPIDLSTIEKRIRGQDNHYKSKQMLFADLMLMVNNCKLYNDEASTYVQCASNLEKFLSTLFHDTMGGGSGGGGNTKNNER